MDGVTGLLWLLFLVAVAAWIMGALASNVLSRVMLAAWLTPREKMRRSLMLASLPGLATLLLLGGVIFMALGKTYGWVTDHCVYHGPGHPHLCFEHLPAIGLGAIEASIAAMVFGVVGVQLARYTWRELVSARSINSLLRLAAGGRRLRRTQDTSHYALAAGVTAPRVLISHGLLAQLGWRERRIVVAHEFTHLRHRDLVRNSMFELLMLFHPRLTASRLRRTWRQAMEERADDVAALRFGAEAVAATLLKVVRLQRGQPACGLGVAGADTANRIERLLAADGDQGAPFPAIYVCWVSILAFAAGLSSSHHLLETALGFLTGH